MLDGDSRPLLEVINDSDGAMFNNAAQVWNHEFLWQSLSPTPGTPSPELQAEFDASFGSTDNFLTQLIQAAASQFGSGWAWLIHDGSGMQITTTANADLPNLSMVSKPLKEKLNEKGIENRLQKDLIDKDKILKSLDLLR